MKYDFEVRRRVSEKNINSGKMTINAKMFSTICHAVGNGLKVKCTAVDYNDQTLGSVIMHAGNTKIMQQRDTVDEWGNWKEFYIIPYAKTHRECACK